MRPDAAKRCPERHTLTRRNGKAPAAARGCRTVGGGRSRGHRPSRGGARSRAGVDRSHGRLPRHGRGWRGQVGAEAARGDHAPISPGGGGKPRSSAFYSGALHGDRRVGTDLAGVLPGTAGGEPQAIPAVAPDAPGAAGPARECPSRDNRDGDRHAVRLLAIRTVRRRIQIALLGELPSATLAGARSADWVTASACFAFLPKLHSAPNDLPAKSRQERGCAQSNER